MNGFVGEFLILLGSFRSTFLGSHVYTVVAATGVIFAAVYMLWMFQRVMFGKLTNPANQSLRDLSKREIAVLVPIVIFIVWIGVYPSTFLKTSAASTKQIVKMLEQTKKRRNPFDTLESRSGYSVKMSFIRSAVKIVLSLFAFSSLAFAGEESNAAQVPPVLILPFVVLLCRDCCGAFH